MFAALSATNEAIMRAKIAGRAVRTGVRGRGEGGKFTSTSIDSGQSATAISSTSWPWRGRRRRRRRTVRISTNAAHPEGRGLTGTAFRSRQALHQQRLSGRPAMSVLSMPSSAAMEQRSGAAFPLLVRGQAVGVMLFLSAEKDTFTPEFAELLQRLADNVSFALENFDRADEKTRADERIEYLASHDSLTNLPNREMFNELLALRHRGGAPPPAAICGAVHRSRPIQDHQRFAGS